MNNYKEQIENKLGKKVDFEKDSDGANLLFSANIKGITVARVYKSFDKNFKPIEVLQYTHADTYPY
jgi:hypothetical protein